MNNDDKTPDGVQHSGLAGVAGSASKKHRVTPMRRTMNGDRSVYGHKCTCGTFWKIYQNPTHNHE